VTVAASLVLQGVDPIGVPWAQGGVLVREVWQATLTRAAELQKAAD
jgi:hypothetical protein